LEPRAAGGLLLCSFRGAIARISLIIAFQSSIVSIFTPVKRRKV
jgi:hypothetical protein